MLIFVTEVATFSLFLFNIIHGLYATRYPRASLPPPASPSKPKVTQKYPITPSRPFKLLSPQVCFSFRVSKYIILIFPRILVKSTATKTLLVLAFLFFWSLYEYKLPYITSFNAIKNSPLPCSTELLDKYTGVDFLEY